MPGLSFLMLIKMSFLDAKRTALSRIEDNAARLLSDSAEVFIQQGIEIRSAFRFGEPAQELLKFLAVHAPFQAVILSSEVPLEQRIAPAVAAEGALAARVRATLLSTMDDVRVEAIDGRGKVISKAMKRDRQKKAAAIKSAAGAVEGVEFGRFT